MRYYYKTKNGNGYLNLKSPVDNPDYIEITEEEFIEATKPKEPTEEQKAAKEKIVAIQNLKSQLALSDYKAIKYAEGWYTVEEYEPIKAEREKLRQQIRELEAE